MEGEEEENGGGEEDDDDDDEVMNERRSPSSQNNNDLFDPKATRRSARSRVGTPATRTHPPFSDLGVASQVDPMDGVESTPLIGTYLTAGHMVLRTFVL